MRGLLVPAVGQDVDLVLTKVIEIGLIGVQQIEIVPSDQFDKLLFDAVLSVFGQIDHQNACIYVLIGIDAQCDLCIATEFGGVLHVCFGTCAQNVLAQRDLVKLGNVAQYYQIAIQIDDLFVFGEQGSDEQTVVGGDGEVIDVFEVGLNALQMLRYVNEINGKAFLLVFLHQSNIFGRESYVQDDDSVTEVP